MTPPGGWRRALGAAFVVTAFAFLGAYVFRHAGELRSFPWSLRPGLLLLSVLTNVVALGWGVYVWQRLLHHLEVRIGYVRLSRVWFLSALGRYIPGKIWQFVGVAHLGSAAGLPPVVAVTSLAVHTGLFLVGAVLAAVYLLPAGIGDLGGVGISALRWAAPLLALLVHPAVIRRALALFHRLARRPAAGWSAGWGSALWLLLLALVGWLLNGLALYLFVASLVDLPLATATELIGANALAFLVGYAVFFAPAGLGAKEGALAALLALYMPAPVAALVAVAARLWTVAAEVIPALVLLRGWAAREEAGSSGGAGPAS